MYLHSIGIPSLHFLQSIFSYIHCLFPFAPNNSLKHSLIKNSKQDLIFILQ